MGSKYFAPIAALILAVALTSCTMTPQSDATVAFTVRGNYQAVADCSFLAIRDKMPDVSQIVLDSEHLVQITYAEGLVHNWDFDFFDAGQETKVEFHVIKLMGPNSPALQFRPIIEGCSQ